MHRTVDAPPAVVWDVLTDHELYGAVAPNLSAVEVVDGAGDGMVRRCVDADGNEWTETCTRWEPGRSFAVSVDVADSEFHRRLFSRFEGEWRLDPVDDGVRITVGFAFEPRYGPIGALVSWYFARRAPAVVAEIFDGWEAAIESRLAADPPADRGDLDAGDPNPGDPDPAGLDRPDADPDTPDGRKPDRDDPDRHGREASAGRG